MADELAQQAFESAQRAHGEAIYASFLAEALVLTLDTKGLLNIEELKPIIDGLLLTLERWRGVRSGSTLAIDHARSRLENLLNQRSTRPGSGPETDEPNAVPS